MAEGSLWCQFSNSFPFENIIQPHVVPCPVRVPMLCCQFSNSLPVKHTVHPRTWLSSMHSSISRLILTSVLKTHSQLRWKTETTYVSFANNVFIFSAFNTQPRYLESDSILALHNGSRILENVSIIHSHRVLLVFLWFDHIYDIAVVLSSRLTHSHAFVGMIVMIYLCLWIV